MLVEGDMLYTPLQALQSLTQFRDLAAGDLIMTGTPVGTALSAPPKPIEKIASDTRSVGPKPTTRAL